MHKKEWNTGTCSSVDEANVMLTPQGFLLGDDGNVLEQDNKGSDCTTL